MSVVGPGGVGKTRLAQRALARTCAARSPTAPCSSRSRTSPRPANSARRLAREIGVGVAKRGADPQAKVDRRSCAQRRMLLVLDNFEHLAAQAALLERHAAGLPALRSHRDVARAARRSRRSMAAAARRPAVSGAGRRTTTSRRSTPRACSSRRRNASSRRWCRRPRPRRSSTSAARSKACRWRWSSRQRGPACCRARRSPPSCERGAELLSTRRCRAPGAAREHRGGLRPVVAAADAGRTRRARAAVRVSRRIHGRSRPRRRRRGASGAGRARRQVAGAQGRRAHAPALARPPVRRRAPRRRRGPRGGGGGARALLPSADDPAAAAPSKAAIATRCGRWTPSSRTAGPRGNGRSRTARPTCSDAASRRCSTTATTACRHEEALALCADALASSAVRARPDARGATAGPRRASSSTGWIAMPTPKRPRCARWTRRAAARDYGAESLCLNVLGSCCLRRGRYAGGAAALPAGAAAGDWQGRPA